MRIAVHVKTRSKKPGVTAEQDGSFTVRVSQPPAEGAANAAVIKALSRTLGVPASRLTLVRGLKSREKVLEVAD